MRRISLLLLIVFLTVLSSKVSAETPQTSDANAAAAVNAFALDVYRQLTEEGGNIFFSPYSISSALAMTYAGAEGDTAKEMAEALSFAGRGAVIHAAMRSLQDRFGSIPEEAGSLDVANRLWLGSEEKLSRDYRLLTRGYYAAGLGRVDFLNASEEARAEINDWVAEKTRGKVQDLLQAGNVTPDTRLILTNAVYFNSAWQIPFDRKLTAEKPFRTGKDTGHEVSMMSRTGRFRYGENSDAQWVKVPYKIPGFSMMIILPRENASFTQLGELEKKLTLELFSSWTAEMRNAEVALSMPKFKDERRYSLAEILNKLGMKLAFTEDADFSGMVEEPRGNGGNLHIDFVVHKAFIELDEEKTEAAAATAVGMTRTSAVLRPEPVIEFNADHPFIYCITDDQTGVILFIGRMTGAN